LYAVCTSRRETADKARRQLGFARATTDFREVTEDPAVDIVHICTPNKFHRDALLSAMERQKHIYCDKPLTATLAEAEDIRRALAAYRGVHQMTLQNRFFPATLRAQELADEGCLGRVLCFRAAYLHAGSVDPNAPLKWKLSKELGGGGVILDLGTHVLDLVRRLCGEFAEVFCVNRIAYPERPSAEDPKRRVPVEAEDLAMLLVRTRDGAVGTVEASKIASGAQDELRFEIHGTHGAMRFNLMQPNHLEVYSLAEADAPHGGHQGWKAIDAVQRYAKPAGWPTPKASIGWMRAHVHCLYSFLKAVASGVKAEPGLETGIRLQEIADAAYRSDATRQWVKV
jgi:predicted dehydrogenase